MKTILKLAVSAFICLSFSSVFAQEQKQTAAPTATQEAISTPIVESEKSAKTDESAKPVIYFYRIKQFAGSALEPSVYVGDKPVARMDNGRYFGVALDPGKYTFRMGDGQTGFELEMKAGQTYYARVSIEMGMWKGHGRLTLIQPEQGAFELKKVKPLGVDKIKERSMVSIYEGSDKQSTEAKEDK